MSASAGCSPAPISSRRSSFTPKFSGPAPDANGRRAILERLGAEAADPVEEFLALALAYEREHVPSLQGFLRWIAAGDIEVKRDFGERQRDELRILTVHGAKGLEAPVVFLPDTLQLPDRRNGVLWSDGASGLGGLPLWCPRGDLAAPAYVRTREALRRRHLQEYRRLLYVALTRAQYRLYVCGWQNQRPAREAPCWHALCQSGWTGLADTVPFDTRPLIGERHGWAGEALRLNSRQTAPPRRDERVAGMRVSGTLPAWVSTPPPSEPSPPKPLAPSRPSDPEPATLSPLAVDGRDRFKRGLLVHRLLQSLPELPEAGAGYCRRAGVSRAAGARADPGGSGRNPRRNHGCADRPRSRRVVGAGIAGRGAGRRADPRRYRPARRMRCRARSTVSS